MPGRPSLGKTASLMISLTPAEKAQIMELAALAGMSASAFLVGLALGDRIGGVIKGEGFISSAEALSRRLPNPSDGGN